MIARIIVCSCLTVDPFALLLILIGLECQYPPSHSSHRSSPKHQLRTSIPTEYIYSYIAPSHCATTHTAPYSSTAAITAPCSHAGCMSQSIFYVYMAIIASVLSTIGFGHPFAHTKFNSSILVLHTFWPAAPHISVIIHGPYSLKRLLECSRLLRSFSRPCNAVPFHFLHVSHWRGPRALMLLSVISRYLLDQDDKRGQTVVEAFFNSRRLSIVSPLWQEDERPLLAIFDANVHGLAQHCRARKLSRWSGLLMWRWRSWSSENGHVVLKLKLSDAFQKKLRSSVRKTSEFLRENIEMFLCTANVEALRSSKASPRIKLMQHIQLKTLGLRVGILRVLLL